MSDADTSAMTPERGVAESRVAVRDWLSALGPLLALAVVFVLFAVADQIVNDTPRFIAPDNLLKVCVQNSTVAIAALGMTVIIIAGGIDLSAGTAIALSATVLAWCLKKDYGVTVSVLAGIGVGTLTGMLNGLLVSLLRVVPFIVTLGTMTIYLGIAKIVAEETTVRPTPDQIPAWLPKLVDAKPDPEWLLLPLGVVWIVLLLAGLVAAMLRYTVFGRHLFAVGSNEATARLCGVNVPLVKVAAYTLAGLLLGIAGMYQFARLTSGNPGSGLGLELKIIAAVVIGGASLSGGRGSIIGTIAGAAMIGIINNGCNMLGLNNPVQEIIIGLIIIAAATLDRVRTRGQT